MIELSDAEFDLLSNIYEHELPDTNLTESTKIQINLLCSLNLISHKAFFRDKSEYEKMVDIDVEPTFSYKITPEGSRQYEIMFKKNQEQTAAKTDRANKIEISKQTNKISELIETQTTDLKEINNKFDAKLSEVTKRQDEVVAYTKAVDEKHDIAEQQVIKTTTKQFRWSLFFAISGVVISTVLGILGIVF